MKKTFYLSLLILLTSCTGLVDSKVVEDFNKIFLEEMPSYFSAKNIVIITGEGDSGNVYKYIKFDVSSVRNAKVKKGWLYGIDVKKGQLFVGGEMVILYQKNNTKWKISWHKLTKRPELKPIHQ